MSGDIQELAWNRRKNRGLTPAPEGERRRQGRLQAIAEEVLGVLVRVAKKLQEHAISVVRSKFLRAPQPTVVLSLARPSSMP